jgi:hypothetical protein
MNATNPTTDRSTDTESPAVHVHTGLRLEPAELDDLDPEVRETVEDHLEFSDAYEIEVRDWGDGVYNVIHRHTTEGVEDGD